MTIASSTSRNDYTGNGVADTFSYTFKILQASDLRVTIRDDDDVETTQELTTDYTVDGAGDEGGGSITLVAGALASGYVLSIRRVVDLLQETDYRNQGSMFPETIESALDLLTMMAQQQQDEIDRSVKLPETVDPADVSVLLPVPSGNQFLAWNSDGTALINVAVGSVELAIPADASVDTTKIVDGAVATAKLDDGAVTQDKLADDSVGQAQIKTSEASGIRTELGLGTVATKATGVANDQVPLFSTYGAVVVYPANSGEKLTRTCPRGWIDGLILSNNATDANNDIDIAAGMARDASDTEAMVLAGSLTKQLDAVWAVGTGAGGLDTGSKANSTWYHVWLIKNPTTGTVDSLFSTSASAPTMPTGYTLKRRIGAVRTDGSGNLVAFTQDGDEILWTDPPLDVDATNPGTSAVTRALTVPTGIRVQAIVNLAIVNGTSTNAHPYLSSLDVTDEAPSLTAGPLATIMSDGTNVARHGIGPIRVRTDTSALIRSRLAGSNTNTILLIATLGWVDPRGRNA